MTPIALSSCNAVMMQEGEFDAKEHYVFAEVLRSARACLRAIVQLFIEAIDTHAQMTHRDDRTLVVVVVVVQ